MSIQRILVVDDDALSREFLVEAVAALGYQPIEAKDGLDALARITAESPDLLITDLRMPGLSGIELVQRAAKVAPGLPSVLVTAQGTIETAVQAMKEGAADFLVKPCTPDALEMVIGRIDRTRRLVRENEYLRAEVAPASPEIVAASARMVETIAAAQRLARSKGTVLVTGESGTGKERIAHLIHQSSPRRGGPFIRVNCAALPDALLESELFGHERGAFTGAHKAKEGRFELADRGTLLLDEIGEIPLPLQAKLLRVLEEEEFERVGGTHTLKVDVRIVATTNRDLAAEVRAARFREDLYYRLHVLPIVVPPLRERPEDVVPLATHFATLFAREHGLDTPVFTDAALDRLRAWSWPGNVRELENVVQRAVVMLRHSRIDVDDVSFAAAAPRVEVSRAEPAALADGRAAPEDLGGLLANRTLDEVERLSILATIEAARGNKTEAARRLGVTARTLSNKLKHWHATGLVA
ncbi:MAG: sigma-54-dependent Fis family transcriptional regulator [Planctomycetes bacterium]|nr:sigma-54-dependent Fis family transcriptional regulator [Planctomycetota bacterium]